MSQYWVDIVETDTNHVEKHMGPHTLNMAEKIARGASINLDHENWHVRIVDEEGNEVE